MARTYDEYSKEDWVYQPNSIRIRNRFRGPRESHKINLRNAQFYYDLNRLYRKLDSLSAAVDYHLELITEGGEIEDVEYLHSQDATPALDDVTLIGVADLASQLENISNRIRRLEEI